MNTRIILILLLSLGSYVYSQENYRIKKVKFKGNKVFNNLKLKEQVSLRSTSYLGEKVFKKDVVNYSKALYEDDANRLTLFYQKEGYLNFTCLKPTIEIRKNRKVIVTFNVDEGRPVVVTKVNYMVDSLHSIDQSLSRKELKNIRLRSKLRENTIFKDDFCRQDQQLINEQFNNMGYAYSQALFAIDVDTTASEASLNWQIVRGKLTHFGETFVTGNDKVPEKKVRRQMTFEKGDVWSKEEIDLTQKRIYNLGMFRVSSLKTIATEEQRDTLPIQINLKEAPRWTTRFGAGYGREDKFRVFGELQKLGFITSTGRVSLYAKHSALEPYNIYLRYTQPAVFFPINTMMIYPFIKKENEPGYSVEKNGFNFSFLQNFTDNFNTSITLFYEDVQQDTTDIASLIEREFDESIYTKSGISLGFNYLNGQPKLDPVRGFSLALNVKTNGLYVTRDMPFYRSLLEYKKYLGISYGLTLAFKGKVGGASATDGSGYLPPEERFYAGGGHSVRGWSRADLGPKDHNGRPIGGKSLLEGSIEARLNITHSLIFAAFMDGGNVWLDSFTYRLKELKYAAGVGVRYSTPIGPAGLDFARPLFGEGNTWQIHFNIGHPF
ncbi:BamA/OMP85 family outer membrane protein [Carboxylicivirga sp. N1Y90]|uniref:BamA/OMP85 family outer membrane protein n=1 Tax=Carboxylicivirga fragile TaxID=3417571 RepID=UPI003D335C9A|nr:BamA/TamA family outer membrane protein [Marinilabiliaceae bacterium N1Y90]